MRFHSGCSSIRIKNNNRCLRKKYRKEECKGSKEKIEEREREKKGKDEKRNEEKKRRKK